ncbi:hypothetical protein RF11_11615 [Thelohanellus kitauei]|uniref:Uncharacterized protein n=1 Tax=Thelohanellus kitauei TaxID=669202 RepID=A0A0C2N039_THEKT|nr:hypothetical protein RF11_11615 [Thelohanellus kitauei]
MFGFNNKLCDNVRRPCDLILQAYFDSATVVSDCEFYDLSSLIKKCLPKPIEKEKIISNHEPEKLDVKDEIFTENTQENEPSSTDIPEEQEPISKDQPVEKDKHSQDTTDDQENLGTVTTDYEQDNVTGKPQYHSRRRLIFGTAGILIITTYFLLQKNTNYADGIRS